MSPSREMLGLILGALMTLFHAVLAQDWGYTYSYSCFKDCGYYKTQEFSTCTKYQRDNCWVPSRRTVWIIVIIVAFIAAFIGLFYFIRKCQRKQAKGRPMSPPPGSMCIWQA